MGWADSCEVGGLEARYPHGIIPDDRSGCFREGLALPSAATGLLDLGGSAFPLSASGVRDVDQIQNML